MIWLAVLAMLACLAGAGDVASYLAAGQPVPWWLIAAAWALLVAGAAAAVRPRRRPQ